MVSGRSSKSFLVLLSLAIYFSVAGSTFARNQQSQSQAESKNPLLQA